jgi:hypothetical protein
LASKYGNGEETYQKVADVCGLYKLNKVCPKYSFLLPKIDRLIDSTTCFEFISSFYAKSKYYQISMHSNDEKKTLFITEEGIFCNKIMPFGLKNTKVTYHRMMNKVFKHQLRELWKVIWMIC